jgi:colicin import membrane protein
MQAATADWAEFAPPPPPAQLRALGLAIAAHVLLLGALAWGVNWRHTDNTLTVEAELWSAVAQQAAPKLEAPPPPPEPAPAPVARPAPPPPPDLAQRNADIALARQKQEAEALAAQQKLEQEQKRRQKIEAEKKEAQKRELEKKRLAQETLDKERQKKLADDKKAAEKKLAQDAQKKEEAAKADKDLKAQREANLRRMAGLAGATGGETSTGSAQRSSGPSASYGGKVAAKVKPNIVFTDDIAGNPTAEVDVQTSPDGSILSRKLSKSSGSKAWDDAVLKAIDKTDKLPPDTDGRVPKSLTIAFRPKD